MRRNIRIEIEYDGTKYHGWQEQPPGFVTIQSTIKDALYQLTGERSHVYGAGRTDSGVHAWGQVANFYTHSKIPVQSFVRALNAKLPKDIVIKSSLEVDLDFHAQFHAQAKIYSYKIYSHKTPPAIEKNYVHWVWFELDEEKMKEGASFLVGTHDFTSFAAANSPRKSNIRTVNNIDIQRKSCYIKVDIKADGFLYRMVRNIVGILILIGKKQHDPLHVKHVLEAKKRSKAGPTAPAQGLFLKKVIY